MITVGKRISLSKYPRGKVFRKTVFQITVIFQEPFLKLPINFIPAKSKHLVRMNLVKNIHLFRLGVTVGYNSSDLTFGWNGYMEGFTVFYLHHTDSLPVMKRSFQLTADIMVTIYFKIFEKSKIRFLAAFCPLSSRQFKSEAQKECMQENHITKASQKVTLNGILELLLENFSKEV